MKHPKTTLLIFGILILIAFDLILTVGVRLALKGTIEKRPLGNPAKIRIQHPVYHHGLKPNSFSNQERWGPQTYSVFVNSLGFRDKEIRNIPPATNKFRIVFMGDSFTEGPGMDFEDTFVGILSDQYADKNIEVLNAGIGSYAPTVYYIKTLYLINELKLKFDHVVVCLDISDIQDEAINYGIANGVVTARIDSFPYTTKMFIHDYTTIGRLIQHYSLKAYSHLTHPYSETLRTQREKDLSIGKIRSSWTIHKEIYEEYGKKGLEQAKIRLQSLYELLHPLGISLTLVVYPYPDQIINHDLDSIQVRFWKEWSQEHDVNFINIFPAFIKPNETELAAEETIRKHYFQGDDHWNKEGHSLVAQNIAEGLQQIGIPPQ
ncbi:hypothetical protein [Candidatus Nitronereus thalassa]|uniref:SGNH hydrolase-type esterase domain-containing protein n=1 Tax=Candidatus Nitronereus thalassa TaxID=3020898 RepID=A0ABU3K610_9BACT|nr:hypothetical protein [Candidatus Nitronereus thalassa]MDT7041797.1 hypothetical protein [Candidatus Nitronereus thalassa]